jgi:Histidine kinase-, DNA gyrase B-, and HSP90-like ATPase
MPQLPLISLRSFIQATRDSGYKTTSSAIAELIDNALEANASTVDVWVDQREGSEDKRIVVTDDGIGMNRHTLQLALQFGGSTRFNSRTGSGRYGMGLPNGSLSQARRVDVYSWQNPLSVWAMSLDVDEVAAGKVEGLGEPVRFTPTKDEVPVSPTGTVVVLSRCDRLDFKRIPWLLKRLQQDFGRWFRNAIFGGKRISVNGQPIEAWDPLYLQGQAGEERAQPYGPPLRYELDLPNAERTIVVVRFSLLPIREWHSLSNSQKNARGISKGAGVSILRAGREIDYGWFFMGSKRKENYDDWWRCEISFHPDADELFGVTHTKQRISPTDVLTSILSQDLERIARELNGIVRKIYLKVKEEDDVPRSVFAAQKNEVLLPPVGRLATSRSDSLVEGALSRLQYKIETVGTDDMAFYMPSLQRDRLRLVLNREHEFFRRVYQPLLHEKSISPQLMVQHLQLLLLSAARAECGLRSKQDRDAALNMRRRWGNVLTAFLR